MPNLREFEIYYIGSSGHYQSLKFWGDYPEIEARDEEHAKEIFFKEYGDTFTEVTPENIAVEEVF